MVPTSASRIPYLHIYDTTPLALCNQSVFARVYNSHFHATPRHALLDILLMPPSSRPSSSSAVPPSSSSWQRHPLGHVGAVYASSVRGPVLPNRTPSVTFLSPRRADSPYASHPLACRGLCSFPCTISFVCVCAAAALRFPFGVLS